MTQAVLEKANKLSSDMENIDKVLAENREHRWIRVIGARCLDLYYSVRFQYELAEWLEQKREQYQKELDAL